jgi:hypothetical protein
MRVAVTAASAQQALVEIGDRQIGAVALDQHGGIKVKPCLGPI